MLSKEYSAKAVVGQLRSMKKTKNYMLLNSKALK